ncbi:MAG TPA: DinB family protein [Terriglobales bacterium]|nr:DinB family protein [Terriglobales bacterium]
MLLGKQLLLTDVRRSAWADRLLLEACAALTAEELARDFRISHTNILSTLCHTYDGERVWLDCLQTTADLGTWRLPPDPGPALSLNLLAQKWPDLWDGFEHWVEEVSETSLEVELNLQLPGGSESQGIERRLPRWKILRHVIEHSQLHRGQVVGMIRMLGHQPPPNSPMDFYLAGEPGTGG